MPTKRSKGAPNPQSAEPEISHKQAAQLFEQYYKLGPARNILTLAEQTGIEFEDLYSLCEGMAWDEKIKIRVAESERAAFAKYQQQTGEIRNTLVNRISSLLLDMNGPMGLPFTIRNAQDLSMVAKAYETLVKADVEARNNAIDATGGTTPKTWTDLLSQSGLNDDESEFVEGEDY